MDDINKIMQCPEIKKPYKPIRKSAINSAGEFFNILFKSFILPGSVYGIWFCYIAFKPARTTKSLFIFYSVMTLAATALITFIKIAKKSTEISHSYIKALEQYEKDLEKYEEDVLKEEIKIKELEEKKYIFKQDNEKMS